MSYRTNHKRVTSIVDCYILHNLHLLQNIYDMVCLYIFYFKVAFVPATNIFVLANVSSAHYQNVKYVLIHT